jgi:hypothetical protein
MPGFGRRFARISGIALAGCASEKAVMDSKTLNKFAIRYTAAWCSQHAASVASFFEEQGSLKIMTVPPQSDGQRSRIRHRVS